MKRLTLLILSMFALNVAFSAEVVNFVEVSGRAEVKVTPNEFTLALVIDEQATKGRYQVDYVEKRLRSLLRKLDIDDKSLTLNALSTLTEKRREGLTTASYELKLSSIEQLDDCYEELEKLGITNVRISKVSHSDIEMYKSQARKAAVKDAQRRAVEVGEALDQEVGGCFEIHDRSSYTNENVFVARSPLKSSAMADSVDPLEFRDITITYNVDAKFVLVISVEDRQMIVK